MTQPPETTSAAGPLAALRRADALIFGGALLVLVFSFLPQLHVGADRFTTGGTANMWHKLALSEVFAVPLLTLVVAAMAALVVLEPASRERPLLVATPGQWRDVLSPVPLVTSVFALFTWHAFGGIGYGAYVVVLGSLAVAAGTLGAPYLPALSEPLAPARTAPAQGEAPTGGYDAPAPSSAVGPPAGWGQPASGPLPADAAPPPAPAAPEPATTYAVSTPPAAPEPEPPATHETIVAPQRAADLLRQPDPEPEPVAAPAPTTQPFWACFPTIRPLLDGASGAAVGEVTPDEWYLVTALDGRGATVQTTDGRVGLLSDVSGMVRADA